MTNKIRALVAAALMITLGTQAVLPVSAESEKWGPKDRETFTWDHPASYPTFNSITDNPSIGDERNFVRVREADTDQNFTDNVDIQIGKEYEVYIYVHNNAKASLNKSGEGIASGVLLKTELPTKLQAGEAAVVKGTITATNTKPKSVWDTAFLHANELTYLRYVPNSATIHNSGPANGKILDSTSLFGEGAGYAYYDTDWGLIPGCNEYAGYVTYRVKADQPDFYIEKTAAVGDNGEYTEEVSAKPGDIVNFKINYYNSGTTAQENVTVHDAMPDGLEYISSSTHITTTADPEGKDAPDGYMFGDGLNIGNFQAGEVAEITYQARVKDNEEMFNCGETAIYNDASVASPNGIDKDKVKIKVVRDCGNETTGSTMPSQLPKTGPAEIALAGAIVALVAIGGGYFIVSRNKLKKAKDSATGSLDSSSSSSDIVKDSIVENDKK